MRKVKISREVKTIRVILIPAVTIKGSSYFGVGEPDPAESDQTFLGEPL
jgi:hypothetical protein